MSTHTDPPRSAHKHSRMRAFRHHPLLRWFDAKFVPRPRIYITQALLAGLALVGILSAEDFLTDEPIIVAAIASSLAIVFFGPHSVASHPFRIIGGPCFRCCGCPVYRRNNAAITRSVAANQWVIHTLQGVSLSLVILFMTITNTEHAPAAATALGLAVSVPANTVLFILSAAVIISIIRTVLYRRLHNLI